MLSLSFQGSRDQVSELAEIGLSTEEFVLSFVSLTIKFIAAVLFSQCN